jgi:molybdopterin/thiamine biosynthesis adenylyltransferase
MDLSEEQLIRYSRQIILKEFGGIGQSKLLKSRITLVGLGALGSPVAYYLTAAGVGHLKLIDFDNVDLSNLHRQILHFTNDLGQAKTLSAIKKLEILNPDCDIELVNDRISSENSKELLMGSDFVIEGSDNIATKMLVNDTCSYMEIPFVIAGVLRFQGQIMTVIPQKKTACYRCIFGDVSDIDSSMSCSQAGVIGLAPSILGSLEASEAVKYLLNVGDLLTNQILYVDLLQNRFDSIKVVRNESCLACGENKEDLVSKINYNIGDSCEE